MDSTKVNIINAAKHLFFEHGFNSTSTKIIAREAGVSEVTLFRKFRSKEELLKEIINVDYSDVGKLLDEFNEKQITYSIKDDLQILSRVYHQFLKKNREIVSIMFDRSMRRFDQHFIEFPQIFKNSLVRYFELMYEKNKIKKADFKRIAELFISSNMGYFLICTRFESNIVEVKSDEFIQNNVELYQTLLEREE